VEVDEFVAFFRRVESTFKLLSSTQVKKAAANLSRKAQIQRRSILPMCSHCYLLRLPPRAVALT